MSAIGPNPPAAEPAARVAEAHWALAAAGQSDLVWGHASVSAGDGDVWMKAAGYGFEEVTPERVVRVTRDGEVVAGSGPRHLEFPIHTELLAARPDVGAVVHTHSTSAAAFASLELPLRALTHDAVPFLNPDIPRFLETGDLISTAELGRSLAAALEDNNGCLIPGHGMVTVGASLASAVMHAALLDRACRIQLQAMASGRLRRWSSPEEVAQKRATLWTEKQLDAGYQYLVRAGRSLARE